MAIITVAKANQAHSMLDSQYQNSAGTADIHDMALDSVVDLMHLIMVTGGEVDQFIENCKAEFAKQLEHNEDDN